MRVLITGGHGFVGRYASRSILRRCPGAEVTLLARPRGGLDARTRVDRALGTLGLDPDSVRVIQGDVDQPRFGLGPGAYDTLAGSVDRVLHAAANVRFDQDLAGARRANVGATARVLRFAIRAGATRLDHVSTCFVAGQRRDRVLEPELEHGTGFRNVYEQSKYEAELLLRDPDTVDDWSLVGGEPIRTVPLAVTVLRPSMVVGESTSGRTSSYHMIYWPLKLYARGYWRTLIGYRETPIDVVPVDFVGEAVAALMVDPAAGGRTFHLAAGPDRSTTIGELAELAERILGGPPVRYLDPRFFVRWIRPLVDPPLRLTRRGRKIVKGGHLYLPYFEGNPHFDTRETDGLLAPHGIRPPRVTEYFEPLVRYAVDADFGRR